MCFAFNSTQRHDLRAAALLILLRTQQNGNAARLAGFPARVPPHSLRQVALHRSESLVDRAGIFAVHGIFIFT
jgi:hypothetical protein